MKRLDKRALGSQTNAGHATRFFVLFLVGRKEPVVGFYTHEDFAQGAVLMNVKTSVKAGGIGTSPS